MDTPRLKIQSPRFNWWVYLPLVLLAWFVNYPGRINPDTLSQLTEAQNIGKLSDCQAPVTTWLYSLFTPALGQPAGALLVQALLVFLYPAVILRTRGYGRIGSVIPIERAQRERDCSPGLSAG
jgi:hypothetical protein